ncbi:GTP-binding protein TrmE N-terminus-domain-containing protein [Leptodontidium sp. 2 PMI_412]|nr:GTP-binding protein TrmE N-terminus-domain-containing protein [Leptodontidium sp. 2 PMI_412]
MIQHAPATARLCARRTFAQNWELPFTTRPVLTARRHGQHSPIPKEANTFCSHQRLFSTIIGRHNIREKSTITTPCQKSSVKLGDEEGVNTNDVELSPLTKGKLQAQYEPASDSQTIYALSTAAGRGAIAIIRISGPACMLIYHALCPRKKLPRERYATVRALHHPKDTNNILDSDAIVLYFAAPHTATGEDMLELHVHGGPATVKAVMSAISEVNSQAIRAAAPGEFTRRAFYNDRLDLGQIESLGDTLSAETEFQRRAALRGRSGELSRIYEDWRNLLIEELAHAAADTDHSEEHSLDDMAGIWPGIIKKVEKMQDEISDHLFGADRGTLLRRGIQVSLIGLPNAGKSSLFNQIVGREASIVNQQAGTTRDVVEATVDLRGYLCTFADTAGVRAADVVDDADIDAIEQEGIKRAIAKAKDADVIVYVASIEPDPQGHGYAIPTMKELASIIQDDNRNSKPLLIVVNKIDRLSPSQCIDTMDSFTQDIHRLLGSKGNYPIIHTSVTDAAAGRSKEANIGGFSRALTHLFHELTHMPIELEHLIGVTERQSQLLQSCSQHLEKFLAEASRIAPPPDNSIATYHLELAAKCLAEVTGRVEGAGDVEEILGVVFSK